MRRQENKRLADIYHSLTDITENVEDIRTKTDAPELKAQLHGIEQKLNSTQYQILETITRDVIDEYKPDISTQVREEFGLKEAEALIHEVEKKAKEMNLAVIIAVYNKAAHPIAVHCMDDAYIASYDIATSKAYTSAALKMPTTTLKKLSQPGQELYGIQFTNQGKIIVFGGGVPLMLHGKLIGALGVSGGNEEQDTKLAEYGSEILEEVMT